MKNQILIVYCSGSAACRFSGASSGTCCSSNDCNNATVRKIFGNTEMQEIEPSSIAPSTQAPLAIAPPTQVPSPIASMTPTSVTAASSASSGTTIGRKNYEYSN